MIHCDLVPSPTSFVHGLTKPLLCDGVVRPDLEWCTAPLAWMGAATTHLSKLVRTQNSAAKIIGAGEPLPSLAGRRMCTALARLCKLHFLTHSYCQSLKASTFILPPSSGEGILFKNRESGQAPTGLDRLKIQKIQQILDIFCSIFPCLDRHWVPVFKNYSIPALKFQNRFPTCYLTASHGLSSILCCGSSHLRASQ